MPMYPVGPRLFKVCLSLNDRSGERREGYGGYGTCTKIGLDVQMVTESAPGVDVGIEMMTDALTCCTA
jgi:hypothetical protein